MAARLPNDATGYIDAKVVRDVLDELPEERGQWSTIARRSGVTDRWLRRVRNGEHKYVQAVRADAVLCALNEMDKMIGVPEVTHAQMMGDNEAWWRKYV